VRCREGRARVALNRRRRSGSASQRTYTSVATIDGEDKVGEAGEVALEVRWLALNEVVRWRAGWLRRCRARVDLRRRPIGGGAGWRQGECSGAGEVAAGAGGHLEGWGDPRRGNSCGVAVHRSGGAPGVQTHSLAMLCARPPGVRQNALTL
jgi:hypothetical protein